ncbi:DUF4041 domain-containing protein [Dermabacteraceae bacterium P13103]
MENRRTLSFFDKLTKSQAIIDAQDAQIAELKANYEALQGFLAQHGGEQVWANDAVLKVSNEELEDARKKISRLQDKKRRLQKLIDDLTRETRSIEAAYDEEHPAEDSVTYAKELREIQADVKAAVQGGEAVTSDEELTVSGHSSAQRKTAANKLRSLALRCFNAEAKAIISAATARNGETSTAKLYRTADQVNKLGERFNIKISEDYISLKARELDLAIKFAKAKEFEKELERERKAELREQAKVERELEAERNRLEKEKAHYANILKTMVEQGNTEAVQRMEAKIAEVEEGIINVDNRKANIRAGYVYVISNVGAFGERMVKIGLTRRLDPMDRVRELGDASVPFEFDVHALFFSDDAVSVEAKLHELFSKQRVNRVNRRREFFYATPAEVREKLSTVTGDLLEFKDQPDAAQFRESQRIAAEEIKS